MIDVQAHFKMPLHANYFRCCHLDVNTVGSALDCSHSNYYVYYQLYLRTAILYNV